MLVSKIFPRGYVSIKDFPLVAMYQRFSLEAVLVLKIFHRCHEALLVSNLFPRGSVSIKDIPRG